MNMVQFMWVLVAIIVLTVIMSLIAPHGGHRTHGH